jgi:hypothetical protein
MSGLWLVGKNSAGRSVVVIGASSAGGGWCSAPATHWRPDATPSRSATATASTRPRLAPRSRSPEHRQPRVDRLARASQARPRSAGAPRSAPSPPRTVAAVPAEPVAAPNERRNWRDHSKTVAHAREHGTALPCGRRCHGAVGAVRDCRANGIAGLSITSGDRPNKADARTRTGDPFITRHPHALVDAGRMSQSAGTTGDSASCEVAFDLAQAS